jgi:adenine deaminase
MMHDIAIATSIAHDSHNIVAMGSNDEQISQAIDTIIAMRGGMVIVSSNATRTLPLPIAGLISDLPIHKVIMEYADMEDIVSNSDISLTSPFMTLSFLALLVIPELKLSDRGLFDANTFKFIRLGV